MDSVNIEALTRWVLWSSFAASFLFGALAQRTHFCTMGAISDVVNMGDWTRARQWMLAIGVAMLGFAVLSWRGDIQPGKSLYASTRLIWLSCLIGGLMFGFGMVLASGCGNKTLVRVGSGNLK
ncbi:MAG: YeeE/YedE family protein, partial [Betaproteobacteria bacterium]|nr:YeeE/YedE family protein [Betaproteobacteria bacterium]